MHQVCIDHRRWRCAGQCYLPTPHFSLFLVMTLKTEGLVLTVWHVHDKHTFGHCRREQCIMLQAGDGTAMSNKCCRWHWTLTWGYIYIVLEGGKSKGGWEQVSNVISGLWIGAIYKYVERSSRYGVEELRGPLVLEIECGAREAVPGVYPPQTSYMHTPESWLHCLSYI